MKFSKYVKKAILVEPEVALRSGVSIEVSGFGSTVSLALTGPEMFKGDTAALDHKRLLNQQDESFDE